MQKSRNRISADDLGILMLVGALLLGGWFRLFLPITTDFPINDGGLFYRIIETVQGNNFRLPHYVEYNGLEIPFAYPPLAFYLAGFIVTIFKISIVDVLSWFPAAVLILVIPAIYHLADQLLESPFRAGLTALIYALIPRSTTWLIMGGGITRSLGQLFFIMAIAAIYLMLKTGQKKYLAWSIVFSALVCLTHPEAAIHTIGTAILLCIFFGRNRQGVTNAVITALGTLALTSPWWITVLLRFGLAPFLSAAQTGLHSADYLIALLVPFSGEPFLPIIATLAVIGFAVQIAKGKYLLPTWYILPFILEPRSAPNISTISMALLACIALSELLLPGLAKLENMGNGLLNGHMTSRSGKLLCAYLLIGSLLGMQFFVLGLQGKRLPADAQNAFEWISVNTPPDSRFLIVTGQTDLFSDYANEWFPVFAKRQSLTTIQGYEWMGDGEFAKQAALMQEIQQCAKTPSALACLEDVARRSNLPYSHILITKSAAGHVLINKLDCELESSGNYSLIYRTGKYDMALYERTMR